VGTTQYIVRAKRQNSSTTLKSQFSYRQHAESI